MKPPLLGLDDREDAVGPKGFIRMGMGPGSNEDDVATTG
jgi:hypothetical protein